MNEELKYQTIKLLVDTNGNKKAAALRIGCSARHINRMISGYRKLGKSFFIHGNQGRQPVRAVNREDQTKQSTTSAKASAAITASILAIEDAHPRRPRCAFFGEMLLCINWFGAGKSQLHIAVDDSTNTIVGAYFDRQETLNGYYHVYRVENYFYQSYGSAGILHHPIKFLIFPDTYIQILYRL